MSRFEEMREVNSPFMGTSTKFRESVVINQGENLDSSRKYLPDSSTQLRSNNYFGGSSTNMIGSMGDSIILSSPNPSLSEERLKEILSIFKSKYSSSGFISNDSLRLIQS